MSEQAASPPPRRPRRGLWGTLKGFVLWEYERASWQYDVMVALILLFVFLGPFYLHFHDSPVYQKDFGSDVVRLDVGADGVRYRVSAELLASYDSNPRRAAEQVLAANLGHPVTITRIQSFEEPDGIVAWYDVWVRE